MSRHHRTIHHTALLVMFALLIASGCFLPQQLNEKQNRERRVRRARHHKRHTPRRRRAHERRRARKRLPPRMDLRIGHTRRIGRGVQLGSPDHDHLTAATEDGQGGALLVSTRQREPKAAAQVDPRTGCVQTTPRAGAEVRHLGGDLQLRRTFPTGLVHGRVIRRELRQGTLIIGGIVQCKGRGRATLRRFRPDGAVQDSDLLARLTSTLPARTRETHVEELLLAPNGDLLIALKLVRTHRARGKTEAFGDVLIARLDRTGKVKWRRLLRARRRGKRGRFSGSTYVARLLWNHRGNLLVGGSTGAALAGKKRKGSLDMFVMELHADTGKRVWARQLGTPQADGLTDMALTPIGDIAVSGYTWGSWFHRSFGAEDAVVMKLDANGRRLWGAQFGGPRRDNARSVLVRDSGALLVVGETRSALDRRQPAFPQTSGAPPADQIDLHISQWSKRGTRSALVELGTRAHDRLGALLRKNSRLHLLVFATTGDAYRKAQQRDLVAVELR